MVKDTVITITFMVFILGLLAAAFKSFAIFYVQVFLSGQNQDSHRHSTLV